MTKYVPENEYLLDKVRIKTDDKSIDKPELKSYLRQRPNSGMFGIWRFELGIYNLSGNDSSKWINRMLRRVGEEPVLFDESLTAISTQQIQLALANKGYMHAKVENVVNKENKKASINYFITSNEPYRLKNYRVDLKDSLLTSIANDTTNSLIKGNMLFNVDVFNSERERIAKTFRQNGYYNFSKEFLIYRADTALNTKQVNVDVNLHETLNVDSIYDKAFTRYNVRNVIFYILPNVPESELNAVERLDTLKYRDYILLSGEKQIIKLEALAQNTQIIPNTVYSDLAVDRTYSSLNGLNIIRYININFREVRDSLLDCYILVSPAKEIALSSELEATYTDGYWGGAGRLNLTHRNIFKGAETLSLQGRVAFEWQSDIWAKEIGGQAGLKFPKFMMPFVGYDIKKRIRANTEYTALYNYQERPREFTSINLGTGMKYSWNDTRFRHSFELFDLSYVYFKDISDEFRKEFLNPERPVFNPYNYENHFIMRIGYFGTYNTFNPNRPLKNYTTMRYSVETAGNLIHALSNIFDAPKSDDGSFRPLNIRYAQYVKAEYDVSYQQIMDANNRFVYHFGVGLAVPYGNADVIPYERRFFSGGANSVRGWSESKLGPGLYRNDAFGNRRDYNQTGDIKLNLNLEYRGKMFWLLEGALFLDAGNVWTIKEYETQPNGAFKLNSFLDQIAVSYGAGLRFDFSFFIARLDMGVKLYDPVLSRQDQWRVKLNRNDFAFHLAIGYPF
jgi:hypothetical protein